MGLIPESNFNLKHKLKRFEGKTNFAISELTAAPVPQNTTQELEPRLWLDCTEQIIHEELQIPD